LGAGWIHAAERRGDIHRHRADSGGLKNTNAVSVNLPSSASFQYDRNGNLTNDSRRVLAYDDDDQLTRVTVAGQTSSGFVYDAFGRMRIRYESNWVGSAWVKTSEVRYIYDGMLPVQERTGTTTRW
jgi:YD repeat-containing protein